MQPTELRVERIGLCPRNDPPVVDRARRAGCDAVHAEVALLGIDDVIVGVMRYRADRARRLASVAADADLGIDEVLLEEGGGVLGEGSGHGVRGPIADDLQSRDNY